MVTVLVSFANTYQAIEDAMLSIAFKNYQDNPQFFEMVVTSLVNITVSRRQHNHSIGSCQDWLFSNMSHCLSDIDDVSISVEQLRELSLRKPIWDAIDEELTFTPEGSFMAWVVDNELWKIIV